MMVVVYCYDMFFIFIDWLMLNMIIFSISLWSNDFM